jgi:uncharacterized protein
LPTNLTPNLILNALPEVNLDDLAARGIEAILLDLDNTICPWREDDPAPGCEEWIAAARARFKLCILSNSIKQRRLQRVGARLGIPAVGRFIIGRKPGPGGYLAALKLIGSEPSRATMIGDQIFTDILGGNRLGMFTIWVLPMQSREFFGTKFARFLESLLIPTFRRQHLMPPEK